MKNKLKEQKIKRVVWMEIKHGDDLFGKILEFCLENNIRSSFVTAIGALQKARFSYYNQEEKKYYENLIEEPVEIVSCLGNVSIKDGEPFIHAHISVGKAGGEVFGGHLNRGCIVFAAECAIFELEGELLERKFDEATGLFLWEFKG